MVHTLRRTGQIGLVIALVLAASCEMEEPHPIVGRWVADAPYEASMTFDADGTVALRESGALRYKLSGRWTYTGNTLTLVLTHYNDQPIPEEIEASVPVTHSTRRRLCMERYQEPETEICYTKDE